MLFRSARILGHACSRGREFLLGLGDAHRNRRLLQQTRDSRPGVFGLPQLHAPEDWAHIASACAQRCEDAADAIRAARNKPSPATLLLFDDLSNEICTVLDAYVCVPLGVYQKPPFGSELWKS